ncbi:hypothetical protein ACFWPH_26180 [Nocardia sp. NPDC058499]|uniref:hypothetical protein n=1 Tax=Nocardia sp. NPDC058499 TaxID=3346530 RepID=UPI00365A03EF
MRAIAKVGAAGAMLGGLAFGVVPAQAAPGIALEPAAVAVPAAAPAGGGGSSIVNAGSSALSCALSTISGGVWCLPG